MLKGGTILGLIGILIGAGGFTIGFIAWSSTTTIQTELNINNALYSKNDGPYNVAPAAVVLEIPNLNITFDLSSISTIYLSFTCIAAITSAPSFSSVFFIFAVDGVLLSSPTTRVGTYQGGSTTDYFAVNLQHLIENMAAGSHNVTVRVSSEVTTNILTQMTLYFQSFAP
jgi:hypothetical protein